MAVLFTAPETCGHVAITLDRPLAYMHFGEITFGVDERGKPAC